MKNNKGQLQAWEALIIVCLLAYSVFITYKWATKQTETKIFQKDSKARIIEPEAHMGCVNVKIEEYLEEKRNAKINPSTNSIQH